ncbi:hypothetical protein MBLNU459_g4400t1 [Dothideomycetes sp. NU459]
MPKHFLVFGATGSSGLAFCKAALEQGHTLSIYARNSSKLPTEISESAQVTVIQGTFDDKAGLERAAKSGADTFVSFAGPVANNKGTARKLRTSVALTVHLGKKKPVSDCYKLLTPLLVENNFRRALVLCTPSHHDPADKPAWKWKASVTLIKLIGGSAYQEMVAIGSGMTAQPVDKLAWTVFRVGFLTNGAAGPVEATYTGSGKDGMSISRESMVQWVLQEAVEDKWVGKAPYICGK